MRIVVALFVFIFGACLFSEGMSRCHRMDDPNPDNTVPAGTKYAIDCIEYLCHEDGSWSGKGCALARCVKQIGEVPANNSLPYPMCCPRPICG